MLKSWHYGTSLRSYLLAQSTSAEKTAIINEEPNIGMALLKGLAETKILADKQQLSFAEATELMQAKVQQEMALIAASKERLFAQVSSGHLHALGFEPPRRLKSEPVVIPPEFLRAGVNWEKDTIKVGELSFVEVRLAKPQTEQNALPTQTKLGRKSRKEYYFECFSALESAGNLDPTISIKSVFPRIRDWLAQNHPDEFPNRNVGSDKTIYKYFNEFKPTLKPKS